ncbi:MAG: transcription antitermination factor NusB [Christensenellales bacterium]|jgi:N utilization substance protein B
MSRTAARETGMRLLYQWSVSGGDWHEVLASSVLSEVPLTKKDRAYLERIVSGVQNETEKLDQLLEKMSKSWRVDRMAKLDLAILRLAAYELLYCEDIPGSVSINEAVELSKRYSSAEAVPFINGILSSIARELDKADVNEEDAGQSAEEGGADTR